jgi:hypothetical protein
VVLGVDDEAGLWEVLEELEQIPAQLGHGIRRRARIGLGGEQREKSRHQRSFRRILAE